MTGGRSDERRRRPAGDPPSSSPFRLLSAAEASRVRSAFSAMLPLDRGIESHLRGVLTEVLAHPGSLARAQLAYSVARHHGIPRSRSLPPAIAIEYFHTASLIFDDLPMMDNATERRGHRCPHVAYGDAAATLGALALITRAYAILWDSIDAVPRDRRRCISRLVLESLGASGILDGQARDLHFAPSRTDLPGVLRVAAAKTLPLIRLAVLLPALMAGAAKRTVTALDRLATRWALAYQILDDFKDCLMSDAETGKSSARDRLLGRPNLPLRAGRRRALDHLDVLLAESRGLVDRLGDRRRFAPLGRLQVFLEQQRTDVAARLVGRPSGCSTSSP